MRIVSGILILVSAFIGITHGLRAFRSPSPEASKMMTELGISDTVGMAFGAWSIVTALLILFLKTFLSGNVLRALQLVIMIAFVLKAGNYRFALIEIPILMLPLILIYLGHPFKNGFLH